MSRSYTYKQIDFNKKLNNLTNQINKQNNDLIYYIYKNYVLEKYKALIKEKDTQYTNDTVGFDIQNYNSFKSFIINKIRQ